METVAVIEDHTSIRQWICRYIDSIPGLQVAGEAGDGQEAYKLCLKLKPSIIVLDIMLPGLNGIELLKRFRRRIPKSKVLIFSACKAKELEKDCVYNGAYGYVEKTASQEVLREAIETVQAGGLFFKHTGIDRYEKLPYASKREKDGSQLTSRENEILQLIAEGLSTRQIGEKLSISTKTAENHRTNLMRKLDMHNAAALTRYALSIGLIDNTAGMNALYYAKHS